MAKTERLEIRLTPELKAQAQAAADADGRSLSNYIELLIRRDVVKNASTRKGSSVE